MRRVSTPGVMERDSTASGFSPLDQVDFVMLIDAEDRTLGSCGKIAPPMPAFYNAPWSVDDIISHSVGRLLDLFATDSGSVKRWQGAKLRPRTGQT